MTRPWFALLIALAPTVVVAEEAPGPLRAYVVADGRFPPKPQDGAPPLRDPRDRTDRPHDFVTELGLNPVLVVLTRAEPAADGPGARIAKSLGELYADRSLGGTSLGAFVTFLTLDREFAQDQTRTPDGGFLRDDKAKQVRDLFTAVGVPRAPFAIAAKSSEQLTKWGVGDADETVVVLLNKLGVVKRWNFAPGQFDDAALKAILDATRAEAVRR